ncbi:MAG: hypothetical protein P4M12_02720 [Gammaproteobacteria bacterium]|nr:hypothetical protein [Gammaproteobacteria bacterium]
MAYASRLKVGIKQLLYLDQLVRYSLLYRASQAFVGLGTIFVITRWFKPEEQGYYYIFASLLGLQVLFELGLSFVILQFSGHEFATLSWSNDKVIQGPPDKIAEFKVFLAKCFKAYAFIAIIAFCMVWLGGYLFFIHAKNTSTVNWNMPWLLLCLATSGNLLLAPFLSIIEGSGLVVQINQFKTIQNTLGAVAMWLAMIADTHLYSIAIDAVVCLAITFGWLLYYFSDLIKKTYQGLFTPNQIPSLVWAQEVWPMQWRMAISWISGYFLSQIYIPIIFYYHDSVSAGKLGMSLAVCNMLSLFSISFMTAYNPRMCQLIAQKKWENLHALFNRLFIHSLILTSLAAAAIFICMNLPLLSFLTKRFVSPYEMLLLLSTVVVSYMIGAAAQLLRAFKREPFVWVSLIGAILNASLAWWFGKKYSILGIAYVYLLVNLCYGLPTAWLIWKKNTINLWRKNEEVMQCP